MILLVIMALWEVTFTILVLSVFSKICDSAINFFA